MSRYVRSRQIRIMPVLGRAGFVCLFYRFDLISTPSPCFLKISNYIIHSGIVTVT